MLNILVGVTIVFGALGIIYAMLMLMNFIPDVRQIGLFIFGAIAVVAVLWTFGYIMTNILWPLINF